LRKILKKPTFWNKKASKQTKMPRSKKVYSKKDSYSSFCSSTSSSSTCPSSSSSSSSCAPVPRKSKKTKDCCQPADCQALVAVETDVFPEVTCDQICKRDAKYNVGVCIDAQPRCCIKEVKSKQISPCKIECVFEVDLGVDYTCKANPYNGCSFPKAEFALGVKNRFETRCAKKDGKKNKH
jgi:hypothetical protein